MSEAERAPTLSHPIRSLAYCAGTAYTIGMQYTLRRIPAALDRAIRERARAEGKSMNEVAVQALAAGLGFGKVGIARRDLADIIGTWRKDSAVEAALAAQDQVDARLWE